MNGIADRSCETRTPETQESDVELEKRVVSILKGFGLSEDKPEGSLYIKEGIIICVHNPDINRKKLISRILDRHCEKTYGKIDMAINYAINKTLSCGNWDKIIKYFRDKINRDSGSMESMEFIRTIANRIVKEDQARTKN